LVINGSTVFGFKRFKKPLFGSNFVRITKSKPKQNQTMCLDETFRLVKSLGVYDKPLNRFNLFAIFNTFFPFKLIYILFKYYIGLKFRSIAWVLVVVAECSGLN
jgi:hypothetical protein